MMVHRERRRAWRWSPVVLAGALACLCSCQKPMFSAKDDRSQFDRYDRVRNQYAPQYVEDEFGRQKPNLKGRLGPKG